MCGFSNHWWPSLTDSRSIDHGSHDWVLKEREILIRIEKMGNNRCTWNPKVALISCRLCENYRLSAFGAKNRRLKQKPSTSVINPHGGEHLKIVYQHQPTSQKSNCLRCTEHLVNADTRAAYGKIRHFHLLFTSFSIFSSVNQGAADYSGSKAQRNWGKWRTTPSNGCVGYARGQRKLTFGRKNWKPSTFVGWYFFRAPWASR